MTLDTLLKKAPDRYIVIHVTSDRYQDCIAWLHTQGVYWQSGDPLNNPGYSLNQETQYGDNTCLQINAYRKNMTYGNIEYYAGDQIIEYDDLFPERTISFEDLDNIL